MLLKPIFKDEIPVRSFSCNCIFATQLFALEAISVSSSSSRLHPFLITPPVEKFVGASSLIDLEISSAKLLNRNIFSFKFFKLSWFDSLKISLICGS